MAHPERIDERETPGETGEKYGCHLSYGNLNDLFLGLAEGFKDQTKGDKEKNRLKLASLGAEVVEKAEKVAEIMMRMKETAKENLTETDIEHKYFGEGREISYLRYDSLEYFLSGIIGVFEDQAEYDRGEENETLTELEKKVAKETEELSYKVHDMWIISEPYMRINTI
jgi:hypothetical protein